MNDIESSRKTLLGLLDKADGLTQAQLAERIAFTPSKLSRLLSGETELTDEDAAVIARGIDTGPSKEFAKYLNQDWQLTEEPAFDHPSRKWLWKAEQALRQLATFAKNPNLKHTFVQQIESLRMALDQAAKELLSTEHPIALIGPPAVGKTTITCILARLQRILEDADDLNKQMALQTGGGRVTISEVHARNGAEYSITVDPCSVDEVSQFVSEFCDDLLRKEDPTEGTPEEFRIPGEVERAIRNIAKLPPAKSGKSADGQKFHREDAARALAKAFPDKEDLLVQVMTRMDLSRRTRTSITYPRGEAISGLDWVAKVSGQINYGHHADFSIPRRIEITVPTRILDADDLDIRVIDTRGVDEPNAPRRDLQAFLDNERCMVVLCTKFDDAPHAATLAVIDRAIGAGLRQALIGRGLLLVLPRGKEDMDQRDSSTGEWVSSPDEGREIKLDHITSTLTHRGCQKLPVQFVNVRSSKDCDDLRQAMVTRVRLIRKKTEDQVDELVGVIKQLIETAQTEEARSAFEAATKAIRNWLADNSVLPKLKFDVHANLIKEMQGLRWASSLRASVNRRGNWHNFDYWHGLGFGARSETFSRCEARFDELKNLVNDALVNPAFSPAHGFLGHFLAELEKAVKAFYEWVQTLGESAFKKQLGDDAGYWEQCRDRWGQGGGYRDQVTKWTEVWFSEDARKQREVFIESEIQSRWAEMLTKLNGALSSDGDTAAGG